jgi:hypothetical protein
MSRSNDKENASDFKTTTLSTAVHGSTFVSCAVAYCPGRLFRAVQAFTPSAYARSASLVSGERMDRLRSAVRRRPSLRIWTSAGSALVPSNSASVPDPRRRVTSIWNNRSSACTQPCRKNRSCGFEALMCGTPSTSRTTDAAARRPGISTRLAAPACPPSAGEATSRLVVRTPTENKAMHDRRIGASQPRNVM